MSVDREVPAGYKQTEVGVIPEDWDVKPLGAVLSNAYLGGNYPNRTIESLLPLMKMGNVGRGAFDLSHIQFIPPGVTLESRHRLSENDVLFNTRNTLDLVGKVAIWKCQLPVAYYNSNLLRLEFDPSLVCSNGYANYALNTAGSITRLRELATGTTSVAAIYTRDLKRFDFLVPPKQEQRAIADALGDVDALLNVLDQLIAKHRDLKQAAMQQLLTGRTRLPGFTDEWTDRRLGEIGTCLRGVSYNPDTELEPYDKPHTFRLLRANNVQGARIVVDDVLYVCANRVSDKQQLLADDIVICMANGSRVLVGKAAVFGGAGNARYTFGAFMGCFRVHAQGFDKSFVSYLFQTHRYRSYLHDLLAGSTINNLSSHAIESLVFALPPAKEQAAIAAALSDMDAEIAALAARRLKTCDLKQAMMQELLTGKTRLV